MTTPTLAAFAVLETDCDSGTGYITPLKFLDRISDPNEPARLTNSSGLVDAALLRLAIEGGDLSAYSEDAQAAAAQAKSILCRACQDANSQIDTDLQAAGHTPGATQANLNGILEQHAFAIARWLLYDSGEMDDKNQIQRQYNRAIAGLELIRKQVVRPNDAPSTDMPMFTSQSRVWTREGSGGF